MKEKISVSIEKKLVNKIDNLIGKKNIQNRSQALELLVREALQKEEVKKAVILTGGEIKNLKRNKGFKPVTKINDKTLIENTIEMLAKIGIEEILILAEPITDKIFSLLGDGSQYDVKITYIKENGHRGTGGALKLAEKYINNTFITLYGDEYFDFDLKKLLNFHKNHQGLATILITTVKLERSKDKIELEGDKVINFEYLPKGVSSHYMNAGICIFEPRIFNFLPKKGSLEKDVFPKLAKKEELYGFNFTGKWKHIE